MDEDEHKERQMRSRGSAWLAGVVALTVASCGGADDEAAFPTLGKGDGTGAVTEAFQLKYGSGDSRVNAVGAIVHDDEGLVGYADSMGVVLLTTTPGTHRVTVDYMNNTWRLDLEVTGDGQLKTVELPEPVTQAFQLKYGRGDSQVNAVGAAVHDDEGLVGYTNSMGVVLLTTTRGTHRFNVVYLGDTWQLELEVTGDGYVKVVQLPS